MNGIFFIGYIHNCDYFFQLNILHFVDVILSGKKLIPTSYAFRFTYFLDFPNINHTNSKINMTCYHVCFKRELSCKAHAPWDYFFHVFYYEEH